MALVLVMAFTLANLVFNEFFSNKSPCSKTGMLAFGPQELSRKSLSLSLEKGKTKKVRHICWGNLSGYSVVSYFSFKKHNPTRWQQSHLKYNWTRKIDSDIRVFPSQDVSQQLRDMAPIKKNIFLCQQISPWNSTEIKR